MGSHGARRGDDDVWERVRAGDIESVADHLIDIKKEKRRKNELKHVAKGMNGDMWFDGALGQDRRRRESVKFVISDMLSDTKKNPLKQINLKKFQLLKALNSKKDGTQSTLEQKEKQTPGVPNVDNSNLATPEKEKNKRFAVSSVFDHIFVRPMAPRETCLKYEKFHDFLPLLKVTESAHRRGEVDVATHMRNATLLTKGFQKHRNINPNALLSSYNDRVKLRKLAENFIHDKMPNQKNTMTSSSLPPFSSPSENRRIFGDTISKALRHLEENSFALSKREKYQCFQSKFREPKRRKKKLKNRKGKGKGEGKKKGKKNSLVNEMEKKNGGQEAVIKELEIVKQFANALAKN
jgi:hypothetical protein